MMIAPNALPRSARNLSAVEAAWVGAFIEADGYVYQDMYMRQRRFRWRIGVAQKDIEAISILLRLTGTGRVGYNSHHMRGKNGWIPIWKWQVERQRDVMAMAEQCSPYCPKLQKVSTWCDQHQKGAK